ncbi:MAG: hypothetical protein LQ347_006845, partial [Umbilicaria vellea]
MHHFLCSLLLAAAVVLTATTAAPTKLQGRSFKVHRERQRSYVPNGLAAVHKAYRKYGWDLPESLTKAPSTKSQTSNVTAGTLTGYNSPINKENSETGDAAATPEENDQEFLAPVSIGGQEILMDFDTGSADLWVFSTLLDTFSKSGHTLYDPFKSATFRPLAGSTWRIQYGDSSFASGTVGTDTVNIGGATTTSQAIELATRVSDQFIADTKSNGLVGLAFSSLNTIRPAPQKTFFDSIRADLALPLFTANLKHAAPGAYEFGFIDPSQFHGELQYTPIDASHGFWAFPSSSFAVGHGPAQLNPVSSPAIADTGTSLMLLDDVVATAYWSQVAGARDDPQQGGWTFPCDAALPDLTIAIGPNQGKIPGALMSFAQVADG